MASIFTGLAFMHGHIVDRNLVLQLGRDDAARERGQGTPRAVAPARKKASEKAPAKPTCATC